MKARPTIVTLATASLALFCCSAAPARADDQAKPPAPAAADEKNLGSDTVAVLVSDTNFGPDAEDADTAARYYCSTRGKLSSFVGKEHPPEFRNQVMQQWAVFTYRCVAAEAK